MIRVHNFCFVFIANVPSGDSAHHDFCAKRQTDIYVNAYYARIECDVQKAVRLAVYGVLYRHTYTYYSISAASPKYDFENRIPYRLWVFGHRPVGWLMLPSAAIKTRVRIK